MVVTYDTTTRIAGIGVAPWTRLGLERWFDNYQIVALYDTDASGLDHMPPVTFLAGEHLQKQNTQHMVQTDSFKKLASGALKDYAFTTYHPVVIANPALRRRFLMTDKVHTTTYENKAWLRETFGKSLPFAPFMIVERQAIATDQQLFDRIIKQYGAPFVLQHEQLSGGKGTFIISSRAEYKTAIAVLPEDGKVVMSSYIGNTMEISTQCCVTRYGTLQGPLQKQIVRNPLVCNLNVARVNGYCGVEVGTTIVPETVSKQIADIVQIIGNHMAKNGYKGIFGIDFLVCKNQVFLLEVNARLTGVTPLLTFLYDAQQDIPFYLLHSLEVGGYPYTIDGLMEPATRVSSQGSLLILQSLEPQPMRILTTLQSGIYKLQDDELRLIRRDISLRDDDPLDAVFVQQYVPVGALVKPGARVLALLTRQPILNQAGEFTDSARQLVSQLYKQVTYQATD